MRTTDLQSVGWTGLGAYLNAPMSLVHFLSREKIGLDFAKAGLGVLRRKQRLEVLIQLRLVFLHGQNIIACASIIWAARPRWVCMASLVITFWEISTCFRALGALVISFSLRPTTFYLLSSVLEKTITRTNIRKGISFPSNK